MGHEEISVADDGHVRVVTLNRPAERNAMTWRMHAELGEAMADADDDVRVVVVTGAPPAFCAGSDLSSGDHAWEAPEGGRARAAREPHEVHKPVIAAINGAAIGIGLTYPLQCDIRFVAADAKLAFAFTRRGVAPELGSHWLLARVVGLSNAADLLISGRTFSGEEAVRIGLATRALPADAVLPAALEYAHDIASHCSPAACARVKDLLWRALETPQSEIRRVELRLFDWLAARDDAREGVQSWLDRRSPSFTSLPSDQPSWW